MADDLDPLMVDSLDGQMDPRMVADLVSTMDNYSAFRLVASSVDLMDYNLVDEMAHDSADS